MLSTPGSPRRLMGLVMLAVLAVLTLSGCVRVQAALAVSQDDLVSGQVIVASLPVRPDDTGPALTIPPELTNKVRLERYAADGYIGQTLIFSNLTFTDVALLTESITETKQFRLSFRRSGDLVTLAGSMDLTQVPEQRADVQVKVAFPGTITRTNGINEEGTISWTPKPGAVTEFIASGQYTDTSGVSWTKWVAIVGSSAIGVSLIVVVLALFSHRRTIRQLSAERAQARER